jgi:hypothetical protein
MKNCRRFLKIAAAAAVVAAVTGGCASVPKDAVEAVGGINDAAEGVNEPAEGINESVARLVANINAVKAGSATANGSTVRLESAITVPEGVTLEVPEGVTLDLTAKDAALVLRDGVVLTVNGTVNATGHGDHGDGWGWVEGSLRAYYHGAAVIAGTGVINLTSKGHLLVIEGDNSRRLTLDGVTLVGLADNDRSLILVGAGGKFILKSGVITGNSRTDPDRLDAGFGGGVYVTQIGTFIMEGGTITGNSAVRRGGGVCNFGRFTMKGGVIFGNSADIGGGLAIVDNNNLFIMEGGRIYGNAESLPAGTDANLANSARDGASLFVDGTAKWGTGGTYTKGGVSQNGGSDISTTDDTLIAVPAP